MKKWLIFILLPLSLAAQTTFNLSTVAPSVNPIPFPPINRPCCGETWNNIETARNTYVWTAFDSWVTQSNGASASAMYTFSHTPTWATVLSGSIVGSGTTATYTATNPLPSGWITGNVVAISGATPSGFNATATITVTGASTFTYPNATVGSSTVNGIATYNPGNAAQIPNDVNLSALCSPSGPLATVTTTDCQWKEYITATMRHACRGGGSDLTSQPGSPLVGVCIPKIWEMWNEFNGNGYWLATYSDLATMSNDAARIIRLYCGDCKIIGGSVSSVDGFNPAGGSSHYDLSLLAYLTAWGAIASPSLPDYISFHAYPARTTVQPAPFPTSIISNSDPSCTTSTPSASCRAAIKDQVATIKSAAVLCNAAITSWACGLPVWITEGGYGINAAIVDAENGSISGSGSVATFTSTNNLPATWTTGTQVSIQNATLAGLNATSVSITKTGANTFTYPDATAGTSAVGTAINIDLTNTWFLREGYTAQWMLALAAQAPAQVMWYAYGDQCWGTMLGSGASQANCSTDPIIAAGTTANYTAFVQTQTWLASSTAIGTLTATPVGPETIWTLDVTYAGLPARFAWYTGWLGSTTYSTSFTQQQSIAGVSSATGGSVTLTQQPILLTSTLAPRCWAHSLTIVLCG